MQWKVNAILENEKNTILVGNTEAGEMVSAIMPADVELPAWLTQFCIVESEAVQATKDGKPITNKNGQNVFNAMGKITPIQAGAHF